ncbi:RNA-binding protein [Bradyrhizobium sp. CIR3A]|uniref:RNA-binding protein n=1 Tax=Bradyrhizobium sp. CIR3A TaxID=2663838 RepID=UPI0017F02A6C|nr:RNA-binding protein [Bradyrhizobium sp. CIR3A]MBB4264283.1 hypothetical protein [Bradyrhizobium sp. CIR3A]
MLIGRIATGEVEDTPGKAPNRAKSGRAGGQARANSLAPSERARISKKAVAAKSAKNK